MPSVSQGGAELQPFWLGRDEGDAIWVFDSLDTVKADADRTGGAFSLFEFQNSRGSTVPLHMSDRWERGFYVLEGDYTFVIGDDTVTTSSGAWIFCPRGTTAAWRCDSSVGRVLSVSVPGGFEAFYQHVGERIADRTRLPARSEPDVQALSATAAQYGITIVGPPPGA